MSQPNLTDLTLFSTSPEAAGFRLESFEVYNWGAFHQNIYSMHLQGENALLTGANGAGKTTLVDALITLLSPNPERFYNQSAGFEDRKRIRRTEDYVLGVYGRSATGKERLRGVQPGEGTYTVLLGVFSNKDYNQFITLAHLYWFKNDQVQKRYYTAPIALNINDHFRFGGDIRDFNSNVTKRFQARCYDSFSEYAADFIPKIGMRLSERSNTQAGRTKPLNLLAKTAGIKVLGNLDGFIRENMLDEANVETYFDNLKKEYADIAETQMSLDKANKQEQMLLPLLALNTGWLQGKDGLLNLEMAQRAVTPWFAQQHVVLLNADILKQSERLALLDEQLQTVDTELLQLRQDDKDLDLQIRQNGGERLDQLARERAASEQRFATQQKEANRYASLATALGFIANPDAAMFFAQKSQIDAKRVALEAAIKKQSNHRDELVGQRKELERAIATLQNELDSLRKRRNNLPADLIDIRARLCQANDIPESELPFVGELVQVLEKERVRWQYALEKLVSPFSLHLLVPPKHFSQVVQWVRSNDLGTLLRLIEADDRAGESIRNDLSTDIAANKMEVLPKSPFKPWLQSELNRRFPHFCTDDTAAYKSHQQALTPEGLYKSGKQHQKDDRRNRRNQFVLGWSNDEKLRMLGIELREKDNQLDQLQQRFKPLDTQIEDLNRQLANLSRFNDCDSFDAINFEATKSRLDELIAEITQLSASSEQLKLLQTRHSLIKKAIEQTEKKRDQTLQHQNSVQEALQRSRTSLNILQSDAAEMDTNNPAWQALQNRVAAIGEMDLQSIEKTKIQFNLQLNGEINEIKIQQSKREKEILLLMNQFKHPKKDILDTFPTWASDTYALPEDPALEHIGQYTDLLDQIQSDQLPTLRERYQARAGSDIGNAMQVFQQQLNEQLSDHTENIENINRSLRTLPYASDTYLQIVVDLNTRKGRVGEFYNLLHHWNYDKAAFLIASATEQQAILRDTVLRIGNLIQRLDKDPDWRREVTDVRNWLSFRTQQAYRVDDTPKPGTLLDSTGALSGGEQAKLTYTVLAAALTYQFNISTDSRNAKSFRFILVDEAFSKLDPENSTYLLDLLSNLHFQMLLITPNSNVKLTQDRMSHLIFVKKEDEMPPRSSVFVYSVLELANIQAQKKQNP